MPCPKLPLAAAILACALPALAQSPAGDAQRGQDYFEKRCVKCHVKEGMGPPYVGVLGRTAGTVKGFEYSEALRASGIVWTEETLDKWLTDPDKLVPGNLMGLKIRNPQLRADLVAYLKVRN